MSDYRCRDAILGKYPCCGEQENPVFPCWEQKVKRADERLAQANRDGIEDSWYEADDDAVS